MNDPFRCWLRKQLLLSLKKSNEKIIKTFFVKSLKRIKCIPVPKLVHKIFLAHSFLHTRIRVWKGTLGPAPFFVVRVFQIMLSCVCAKCMMELGWRYGPNQQQQNFTTSYYSYPVLLNLNVCNWIFNAPQL